MKRLFFLLFFIPSKMVGMMHAPNVSFQEGKSKKYPNRDKINLHYDNNKIGSITYLINDNLCRPTIKSFINPDNKSHSQIRAPLVKLAWLFRISIQVSHQHKGYGTQLLNLFLQKAAEKSVQEIAVCQDIDSKNIAAQMLLTKAGFQIHATGEKGVYGAYGLKIPQQIYYTYRKETSFYDEKAQRFDADAKDTLEKLFSNK